jgi:transposase
MTPREERGLVIAALCKLSRQDATNWLVPSQSGDALYSVNPERETCSCLDHTEHGHVCKHVYAVKYTIQREVGFDGEVVDTETITFTEKKTYRQNWPAYNRAQSIEKDRFQELLVDLCQGIPEPEHTRGRKPHSLRDMIFAMVFKVFEGTSSRRVSSDFREAHKRGHLAKPIPGVKVCAFFENPAMTPILRALVARSARPLRAIEKDFAIDSSGFATCKFERWYDHKFGVTKFKHTWVKVHAACGVKTNIVTAVRILDKDAADAKQFIPLVRETSSSFSISEVSADKAYGSLENFEAVAAQGGTGFIAFKANTTGAVGGMFEKMFHLFQYRREEYLAHYHKRSNVESTFSMVKRKFGDYVRAKTETAMVNEVLCKFLAHNLCVNIQEQCELGIASEFWDDRMPTVEETACNEMDLAALEWVG